MKKFFLAGAILFCAAVSYAGDFSFGIIVPPNDGGPYYRFDYRTGPDFYRPNPGPYRTYPYYSPYKPYNPHYMRPYHNYNYRYCPRPYNYQNNRQSPRHNYRNYRY